MEKAVKRRVRGGHHSENPRCGERGYGRNRGTWSWSREGDIEPSPGAPVNAFRVVFILKPKNGAPAKTDGLCGEEEKPGHWRNFLLAGNGAVWLAR